ncbi:hypothetical protein [Amycolatopsis taiwanensis]|uniref:Uncharacterized protein n=1 Tax=Amycolatopsis taiwanensis TaxID=342230 RepID=A0A9W6QVH5_9PSEU|nr:hypothetical protein [Amycolatopsis taiwanensis]GLY64796.1 hypothetical protein Atai01_14150 [Amycolatopsis taiwanensis]
MTEASIADVFNAAVSRVRERYWNALDTEGTTTFPAAVLIGQDRRPH